MKEASLVTGKVFTKLFFSFVVVLFLGMVVLDFSLRQVMEHSLRAQADDSLVAEARLVAAHLVRTGTTDPVSLQQMTRLDAAAAGVEVSIFNAQGQLVAASQDNPETPASPAEVADVLQRKSLGRAQRNGNLYVAVPAGQLV